MSRKSGPSQGREPMVEWEGTVRFRLWRAHEHVSTRRREVELAGDHLVGGLAPRSAGGRRAVRGPLTTPTLGRAGVPGRWRRSTLALRDSRRSKLLAKPSSALSLHLPATPISARLLTLQPAQEIRRPSCPLVRGCSIGHTPSSFGEIADPNLSNSLNLCKPLPHHIPIHISKKCLNISPPLRRHIIHHKRMLPDIQRQNHPRPA